MRPIQGLTRRRLGIAAVGLAASAVLAAHAAPPMPRASYEVEMSLDMYGQASKPRVVTPVREPFAVSGEKDGKPWQVEFILRQTATPGHLQMNGRITRAGETLATPVLVGKLGETVRVRVGDDVRIKMVIKEIAG
jgi:hypothetical protein